MLQGVLPLRPNKPSKFINTHSQSDLAALIAWLAGTAYIVVPDAIYRLPDVADNTLR